MDLSGVITTRQLATFNKFFKDSQSALYPYFKTPHIFLAKTPFKNTISCLLTFQQCHFKLPVGSPVTLVSLKISILILFPGYCDGPLSLSPAIIKTGILSMTNGDVTFPHSPLNLNCPIPTVDPKELFFSCLICSELSALASMVKVLTIVVCQL